MLCITRQEGEDVVLLSEKGEPIGVVRAEMHSGKGRKKVRLGLYATGTVRIKRRELLSPEEERRVAALLAIPPRPSSGRVAR